MLNRYGSEIMRAGAIIVAVAALGSLAGCQSELMSDDSIASNTAGVIGVPVSDVTITDRRSDGATNTYYIAHTKSGATYACTINGGGLLAIGMTNPPSCTGR